MEKLGFAPAATARQDATAFVQHSIQYRRLGGLLDIAGEKIVIRRGPANVEIECWLSSLQGGGCDMRSLLQGIKALSG